MKVYLTRTTRVIFGLFLFALGSYLTIQANIGLAPWEAFGTGCNLTFGISYGNATVLTGLAILAFSVFLKEKIGLGTILNTVLIGKFVDLLKWLAPVPYMTSFAAGVLLLLLGQFVVAVGSWLYMGGAMGSGPRDSLMVALDKRFPRVPIGVIRGAIEAVALGFGWLMGAPVGAGTIIAVCSIGFIVQFTFKLFRFDAGQIRHESVVDTFVNVKRAAVTPNV